MVANDEWDFDLAPWVESGKVHWIEPGDDEAVVRDVSSGKSCPCVDLEGDRFPQILGNGRRIRLELSGGTPVNPYEE